jgi:alkane 1-monooxygenase
VSSPRSGAVGQYATGSAPEWTDPKRHLWLLGTIIPLLPFAAWGLVEATGLSIFWWFGPIFVFGIVPVLDLVVGRDGENPPDEVLRRLEEDRYYRWVTFAFLPVQYAAFAWSCWAIVTMDLSVLDRIGLAVTLGCVGGVAINTAHELGHKRQQHERWFARIALAPTFYGHFFVEHNRGHHVRVATPEDPASARLGETIYEFWPRTIVGSLRNAWRLERVRLTRRGGTVWTWRNDILTAWAMSLVLWGALVLALGPSLVPYLLVQAVVGVLLLEAVNYLEHYGLRRQRVDGGRYERVDPSHSWNSNNIATNVLLYHLQRHSDHHANPTRRYQGLRDDPRSPVLPTGYAGMVVLSLVPPAWRAAMDPLVLDHVHGDTGRVNLHPRTRKRYPSPASAPGAASTPSPAPTPVVRVRARVEPLTAAAPTWRCPGCGYSYCESAGHPREGLAAGTPWALVPDEWCCPDCGVRDKVDFVPVAPDPT